MHLGFDQQNMSFSEENILANSIRNARQKIGKQDQHSKRENNDRHDKDMHNQTFSFSKHKKQNSAAQAIKVLHIRISELQAFNNTLTNQNCQLKRQINLKNLQIQSLNTQSTDLHSKNLQNIQKITKIQKSIKIKQAQIRDLQLLIKQKENQYKQDNKNKEFMLEESNKVKQMLEAKVNQLNKRIDNNQKVIVQMIRELEEEKQKGRNSITTNICNSPHVDTNYERNKHSKSNKQKQFDNFPVIVDQPIVQRNKSHHYNLSSNKIKSIRQSVQPRRNAKQYSQKKTQKNIQNINKELQQKNKELYNMLRNCERKYKEEQKAKNQYKERFYNLKNTIDLIVQQINRLPNNLSHKFKCLIVKIKKIENDNLQCLRSHSMLNRNRFHSKSSINSSKESSAASKSRQKKLKMEDLNMSDHTQQIRSHSKSKRKSLANYLKSHSGKKAIKTNIEPVSQQNQIMRALTKKIRSQRKQLCQMYKKVKDETNPLNSAQLRNQFQQKMAQNVQLQSQLQNLKRTKAQN